tara:strand:+ start:936 stop:3899 length:2964 start_codon:yes stop_codon:yes gene_type:complete
MSEQQEILKKGKEIFQQANESGNSIFNKDWWYGKVMEWSMRNEQFKTQMFRFVDVLPYLQKSSEVSRHLKEYFAESGDKLPSIFNFGVGIGSLAPGILATTVKKNVLQMAKMFIVGEDADTSIDALEKLRKQDITFTVDLLGEACLNEKEALEYQNQYIDLIQGLHKLSQKWEHRPLIDENHLGKIPSVNVSVKISALYSQIKLEAWEESKKIAKERLRTIFQIAKERQIFINLDLEKYEIKDFTFEVFKELAMEEEFRNYPHFGLVIQAYLRDSEKDTNDFIAYCKQRGTPITVRLVKGAYWDYETVDSEQKLWPYPVYTNKAECDANYEKCAKLLLSNYQHIHIAIASHNVRSLSTCLVYAEKNNIPKNAYEIQMLYGMADDFKRALVKMGYRVRVYAPIGELIPGMAYLVRRLLENTSNESFLRSKYVEGEETEKLLQDPQNFMQASASEPQRKADFYNEPLLDFVIAENRQKMQTALDASKKMYQEEFPVIINGEKIHTGQSITSLNPSNTEDIVGKVSIAGKQEAEKAIEIAEQAWHRWRYEDPLRRAQYLDDLAEEMLQRRFELNALIVREVGKTWKEADGDVTEAIDFCRYYAKDMRGLSKPERVGRAPGEISMYQFQGRGVCLVIAPWNFPLAILTGMTVGALVTGNTVLMKPAEESSVIAAVLMQMLQKVGVPKDVLHFLPGYGEEVGAYLVEHPKVSTIAFTGSKEVGLQIVEKSAKTLPGQRNVKRCLIEMGGKNAIVVDSDADLDEAVAGIVYSAFAFAGQKCSACSRVIVVGDIYERLLDRLVEATKSIAIGSAEKPKSFLGPVSSAAARDKIMSMIEKAKQENHLLYQGEAPTGGFYIAPTIFTDVNVDDYIAQEEVFGPVLAIIRSETFEEAIRMANATPYALTGALYSRSPANIEYAKKYFDVGNCYINRGCTAAMVERHPFGGYKLSGVGNKTGGPDYLKQFMDARLVSENTLRRGFAPEEKVLLSSDSI